MTKWKIILILTISLIIGQQISGQTFHNYSQDTIVFQKKKDKNKQFKLPLNDYPVLVKQTNEKRKQVIITNYTDSTLIVKTYSFKKGDERKIKKDRLATIYSDTTLTANEIDSLTKLVFYSIQDTITISQIDKLIISNRNRKEMKQILNTTEWSAVTWLLVGIPAMALFKSVAYFVTWSAVGITIVVVSIITENKKINFDKWEIIHCNDTSNKQKNAL